MVRENKCSVGTPAILIRGLISGAGFVFLNMGLKHNTKYFSRYCSILIGLTCDSPFQLITYNEYTYGCFFIYNISTNWCIAREKCLSLGGDLAILYQDLPVLSLQGIVNSLGGIVKLKFTY